MALIFWRVIECSVAILLETLMTWQSKLMIGALGIAVSILISAGISNHAMAAEPAVVIPAPAMDNPKTASTLQTAVIAGGCFWGVQGVYQHVKGVRNVLSGYAGGDKSTAEYETVSGGNTGHAESVQISFDPKEISYGEILQIYFSVAHDPTQLNRQGPDAGTQYRSSIFYSDEGQKNIAQAYIAQLNKARVFNGAIVTRVEPLKGFYPAEDYHQDFLVNNPRYPYIVFNDLPKVQHLKQVFPTYYRDQPVTVKAAKSGS
jgi:peptide-methionine (S)-S-oxide reductase